MRHRATIHWIFCLCALTLFAFGCERASSTSYAAVEPPKPKNVPSESVWVGGYDGGVFVFVKKAKQHGKGVYVAQIHAQSGYLEYKGKLKMSPPDSADFETDKKESYSFWGGDSLHLRDGRVLNKVK
jgi:hypothetical protein